MKANCMYCKKFVDCAYEESGQMGLIDPGRSTASLYGSDKYMMGGKHKRKTGRRFCSKCYEQIYGGNNAA